MSDLEPVERQNVAGAIQLIREAGYRDKAALLDDKLQNNDIKHDPFLEPNVDGEYVGWPFRRINLNANVTPLRRLPRNSPEMLRLAGVLLHEADYALGHDELDAFGEEIAFYKLLNRNINQFFPGATPAEQAAIERRKTSMESDTERQRDTIARRGGKSYGEGFRKTEIITSPKTSRLVTEAEVWEQVEVENMRDSTPVNVGRRYPDTPSSRVQEQMNRIANMLLRYREFQGSFPRGGNAEMVAALRQFRNDAFPLKELNERGEVVDPWGEPYVYKLPGRYFPEEFDLYSLGPCKNDRGGDEDNILCELHRR